MGFDDRFETADIPTQLGSGPAVGVFVSPDHCSGLAARLGPSPRIMLRALPLQPNATIPPTALGALAAAIVEVDPTDRKSIDRLVHLTRHNPTLPVIAAMARADLQLVRTLLREGVADVIALPLEPDELTTAALDAQARRAVAIQPVALAPLVCVARSSGGCGATTVATHLAAALNAREWDGKRAVLGDLDLQFGCVGAYLDMDRAGSFADLITARDRIDSFLVGSIAGETDAGLAVISAPDQILPLDAVDLDGLLVVVEQLRRQFGLVILDLPVGWSNWSASVAALANLVLLVTQPSLSSIRQARRSLDLFETLGVAADRVRVVANRAENKLFRPISAKDIADTLQHEILATLPDVGDALSRAQDQGLLIGAVTRRSPFATAIDKLADAVEQILKQGADA